MRWSLVSPYATGDLERILPSLLRSAAETALAGSGKRIALEIARKKPGA